MPHATDGSLARIVAEIPLLNRPTVESYLAERLANGVKLSTLANDSNHLRKFAQFLDTTPFESVTRDHVRMFLSDRSTVRRWKSGGRLSQRADRLGQRTLDLRKVIIKAFMRWLRGTEDYPPEVRWLKSSRANDKTMPVEQVLTRGDLLTLIGAAHHPQLRAIVATLYDSGCRASEFVSLRIRDVSFDEFGAVLTLPKTATSLKTGSRRIRVLHCTGYLRDWINQHPRKTGLNPPLWISFAYRNLGDPLTANALNYTIRKLATEAKLGKEVWPHLFRHSRATECAREGWPEGEMRALFGWSKDSNMPSTYVHLSGKDYEDNMLRRAGKLDNGRPPQPALAARICQCGLENLPSAEYCSKAECGRPLTVPAAARREKTHINTLVETLGGDASALDQIATMILTRARDMARDAPS